MGGSRSRGLALALAATLLWSTTSVLIDPLVNHFGLSPIQVSLWRALLVTGMLAGIIVASRPRRVWPGLRALLYYAVYGAIGIAVLSVLWSRSVQVNKASVATALIFSAPVFVAIGSRWLVRERIGAWTAAAVGLNVAGCALVAGVVGAHGVRAPSLVGLGLGLASGVAFAAYTLLGRGAGRVSDVSPLVVLAWVFGWGTLALLGWGLAAQGPAVVHPALDAGGWGLLLALAAGPTLLGYLCYTASVVTTPAIVVSLLSTLELPITAFLARVLLGRRLDGWQSLGAAAILLGAVVLQVWGAVRGRRRRLALSQPIVPGP